MDVITSQVSIRRIKEERLFLSPLSRNNHTFYSRGITLSSSEFVCIKTRMGLNIRVNSFVNGALTENLKERSLNRLESQVQFLASITVHIVKRMKYFFFQFPSWCKFLTDRSSKSIHSNSWKYHLCSKSWWIFPSTSFYRRWYFEFLITELDLQLITHYHRRKHKFEELAVS